MRLDRLDLYLSSALANFGESVARSPLLYLMGSLITTALFATGLQRIEYESDPEYLFVPRGARSAQERKIIEETFPTNLSRFIRGSESRLHQVVDLTVVPKVGADILDPDIWKETLTLVQAIETIQVTYDEKVYNWKSLCVRFNGDCVENSFLAMHDVLGTVNLTYPIHTDTRDDEDYPLAAHIGGIQLEDGHLVSAKALKITFILDDSTKRKKRVGEIWTQVVLMYAMSVQFQHIQVFGVTDKSIEKELSFNIDGSIDKVPATLVLVICFAVYNTLSTDWVRSKPLLGVVGVLVAVLSGAGSFGFAMYCGLKWQAINQICLFLLIGIGLDDTFVMLSAWWRTEGQGGRDVVSRISMTYADAAVSITITSLTNIISFFIGAIVPGFPCVQIFCIYTGLGLTLVYFWTLTIFGACLTLAGHLEHANRHSILFIKVKSKSEAADNWLYSVGLQGGISRKDPTNTRDNKEGKMMVFFRDVVAPVISHNVSRVIIIIIFFAYLGVSIYGIMNLQEGLERSKLVGDYSYTLPFFDSEDVYFRDYPYRFQIVIHEEIDYYNQTVQNQVKDLIHQMEDSKFISDNPDFRQSWLHRFLDAAEDNFILFDLSTRFNWYDTLDTFLTEIKDTPLFDDVVFGEDKQTINASRFFLQSCRVANAKEEVEMLEELRGIVDSAPFKVTIYHQFFGFFDQFSQVSRSTMDCVIACCCCMTLVTILFIPNKSCVIWVTFTIFSVELGVIGFMALLGIGLDVISMIVLIMGIGFSVDFSAHISYHYLSAGDDLNPKAKLAHCLHALGPPILRGGLTTLLGTFGLAIHPSYITHTFSKMIFLIIILGVLHGLFLLPVLLTLFGPGACSDYRKFNKSGVMSPTGATLSETFTYHTQLTASKERGSRTKESSLRKLVLSGEIKKANVNRGPFNDSGSDSADNGSSPFSKLHLEFSNYNLDDPKGRYPDNLLESGKEGSGQLHNRLTGYGRGNLLPYYKFAHVKRAAHLPDSRNEHFWTGPKQNLIGRRDSWQLEDIDRSATFSEDILEEPEFPEEDGVEEREKNQESSFSSTSSTSSFEEVDLKKD